MKKYCLNFLEGDFSDISILCFNAEKFLVEKDYNNSIIQSLIAINDILFEICKLHHLNDLLSQTPLFINKYLFDNNFTSQAFFKNVSQVFAIHNNYISNSQNDDVNDEKIALKLHKLLFNIGVSFYRSELNSNFKFPIYNGPIYNPNEETLEKDNVINGDETPKNEEFINDLKDKEIKDSLNISLRNRDSNLLNQLLKLRDSSKEAVDSSNEMTDFKKYMHVNRSIQDDFIRELKRVENEISSHLIMLCGSVGDGKSHMLAYVKTNYPDLYNKFKIHNDATESFDPDKNAIDTLVKVLEPFNDDNFNSSNDKIILAINLGVLNKFLESDYCKNNFSLLNEIIYNTHIFDSDVISKNIIQDKVSFINFSDYNLFELSEEGTSSNYISSLFERISSQSLENPFYNAYIEDKKLGYENVIISNYEMFMDKNVQEIIIHYLIKIFIKYKKIISTRDLLNFVYEIIVPPVEIKGSGFNPNSFKYLLPNLLFNNFERSSILKLFNNFDPTRIRNKELDKFIIDLYIHDDFNKILNEYFCINQIIYLKKYFDNLTTIIKTRNDKSEVIAILIRLLVFYGKDCLKIKFEDETYNKFLKYLYYYNLQSHNKYKKIFSEIKNAIFNWRGSLRKNYLCIDELNDFKIFKYFNITNKVDKWDNLILDGFDLNNRFKTEIKVFFAVPPNDKKIELNVDFSLYEYISKLNKGFKPNKNEKDDLVIFDDFINLLIENDVNKNLIIKSLEDNINFSFEYDVDFGTFEFKRV